MHICKGQGLMCCSQFGPCHWWSALPRFHIPCWHRKCWIGSALGGSLCLWEGGKKGWFDQTLQLDRQPIKSRAEWCCLKIFSQFFSLLCKLNQSLVSDAQWKHISLKLFHLPDFDFGTFFGNGVSAGFHTALGRDCMGRAQGDYFYGCQVPNLRLLFLGCH